VIPLVLIGAFLYLYLRRPSSASPSQIVVDRSSIKVERGRYLFTNL